MQTQNRKISIFRMISTLCPKFKVLQLFPFSFFSTKFPARGDRIQIQFGDKWAPWRTEQIVDLIKVKHKAPTYTYRFYRIHQIWVKGEIPPSFGHFRYHWEFAPPPPESNQFWGVWAPLDQIRGSSSRVGALDRPLSILTSRTYRVLVKVLYSR